MDIVKYPTYNKSPGRNECRFILLHHTGAVGNGNISAGKGEAGQVSFHYLVRPDGTVCQFGTDEDILRHAGQSEWNGLVGMNQYSIGVEIESDGSSYTDLQRRSVKELCQMLMERHSIPATDIIRHKDVSPGRKWDVSDAFWNVEYDTREEYRLSLKVLSMTESQIKVREAALNTALCVVGEMWQNATPKVRKDLESANKEIRAAIKRE